MDSPPSDASQTRFSTPVSELDDHRNQSSTRARGDTLTIPHSPRIGAERRLSVQHPARTPRSETLQLGDGLGVLPAGTVSRDFENVIIDDDKSGTGERVLEPASPLKPSPPTRRSTCRRSLNVNRSRDSSRSSSSSDNSVDAFADSRRRERGNTIGSRAPSELSLCLQRTVSGGTHQRRPTFSNESVRDAKPQDDRVSNHVPAENDICFPTEEEESERGHIIDFEELDEFVAEHHKVKPPLSISCERVQSDGTKPMEPRMFDDLRPDAPKIRAECADLSESDEALNEKSDAAFGPSGSREKLHKSADLSRYSFFSSELEQTIHATDFVHLLAPDETFRDLFQLPDDGGVWWLDVCNPTEEELHVFQRAFGIHRLTTEDIITQEAREKVELFKQYYFVCFRSFFQADPTSENYMEPVNVYMVVFREGIVSITFTQSPHASSVRQRISKLRDYMALTADWICYAMM